MQLNEVSSVSVNALHPLVLAVTTQKLFPCCFLSGGSVGGSLLNGLKRFLSSGTQVSLQVCRRITVPSPFPFVFLKDLGSFYLH